MLNKNTHKSHWLVKVYTLRIETVLLFLFYSEEPRRSKKAGKKISKIRLTKQGHPAAAFLPFIFENYLCTSLFWETKE